MKFAMFEIFIFFAKLLTYFASEDHALGLAFRLLIALVLNLVVELKEGCLL